MGTGMGKRMLRAGRWTAVLLLLAAAGCREEDRPRAESGSKPVPVTLTMFSADVNPNYEHMQSPVGKAITERTGVILKLDYPVGDPKQKLSLMAASGNYPDLVYAKNDISLLVEAGGLIDLTPLIDQYGPNIKKLYGENLKRLRWSLEDRSIYFLGAFGVGGERWEPESGFMLQHRVVRELGYPPLKTLDDFERSIRAYLEKHPVTEDGQKNLGLSLLADDWRLSQSVTNPAVFATGGSDDGEWYIDDRTMTPVLHLTRPEEKEYFRWLNHMYHTGLLDPESFIQKYDQYKAKIASGRVLALIDSKWQVKDAEQALSHAGMQDRMYGMYPVTMGESFRNRDFQPAGYSAGWGIGISRSAKDPVSAIRFLDWMCSDEAQILNNWGVEGIHYRVENGRRVIPEKEMQARTHDPDYNRRTGIGVYVYPFPQRGDGVKDPGGQTYLIKTEESIAERYSAVEREVLQAYGAKLWRDLYPRASEFPVKPWGTAWQINIPQSGKSAERMQRYLNITRKRIPEMILSKPDAFDGMWDRMQKELDAAEARQLEQDFGRLLRDRMALWNEP